MRQIIADAFLRGGQNAAITTYPGRRIDFRGGHARIVDERDMPALLRMSNIVLEVRPEKVEWLPGWMKACGEWNPPKADVRIPQGFTLGPAPDYELIRKRITAASDAELLTDGGIPEREPTVEKRIKTAKTGWSPLTLE